MVGSAGIIIEGVGNYFCSGGVDVVRHSARGKVRSRLVWRIMFRPNVGVIALAEWWGSGDSNFLLASVAFSGVSGLGLERGLE